MSSVDTKHNWPDLVTVLKEDHDAMTHRRDELLDAFDRVPFEFEDDDEVGRGMDFIKQLSAAIKDADAARRSAKEPYLEGGRIVDTFFKGVSEPLDKAKREVNKRVRDFKILQEKIERDRRREEERKAREEEDRRRKEAAEALRKMESEREFQDGLAKQEDAELAAAEAAKASKEAAAPAADLTRSRGEYGSVGSLRTVWVHDEESLDRDEIDLEALRHHLPEKAIHQAIRSFIKAGGRHMPGVRIYEDRVAVVR